LYIDEKMKKIEKMREILASISEGVSVHELKKKFGDLLKSVKPWEIPIIEQELIRSGISVDEIARLCDLHVELFREFVSNKLNVDSYPDGHPLRVLVEENDSILKDVELLGLYLSGFLNAKTENDRKKYFEAMKKLVLELMDIKKHFVKEQMLLFPYLERLGITAVPTVLWMKQDEVYFTLREVKRLIDDYSEDKLEKLKIIINDFIRVASDMVFRENNIFYPTMAVILSDAEWYAVKIQEEKIGYYKVEPKKYKPSVEPVFPYKFRVDDPEIINRLPNEVRALIEHTGMDIDTYEVVREDDIKLDYGYLNAEEIDAIFKALPVEITFVGADGRTRYFSNREEMVFVRTPSIIGRKVEFCHPPRSIELVKNMVKSFLNGRRDPYVFWAKSRNKTILVQYIPVIRDKELIGIMEVAMDVTKIKDVIESGRIPYFKSMSLSRLREIVSKNLSEMKAVRVK